MREEAVGNYEIGEEDQEEEVRLRLGPLAEPTPAGVRNRGAAERKGPRRRTSHGMADRQAKAAAPGATGDNHGAPGSGPHNAAEEESTEDMDALLAAVAGAI